MTSDTTDCNPTGFQTCEHCGGYHALPGKCDRIKAIEYHENGQIKRVEYHDRSQNPWGWQPYPPPYYPWPQWTYPQITWGGGGAFQ